MKVFRWITLLLLLVAFRFINLLSLYLVNHLEIGEPYNAKYLSVGFADETQARKKLTEFTSENRDSGLISVVSAFDMWNSFVFYIYNPDKPVFVNLGSLGIQLGHGYSTVAFSPAEIIRLQNPQGKTLYRYKGVSLIAPLIQKKVNWMQARTVEGIFAKGFSYMIRSPENSKYLYIPFLFYFYLPLIIILIAAFARDAALLSGLVYYLGIFILFDFKKALVTLPFGWLFKFLGFHPADSVNLVIAIAILLFLLFLAFKGFTHREVEENKVEWRGIFIFFFLMLPLFLRF